MANDLDSHPTPRPDLGAAFEALLDRSGDYILLLGPGHRIAAASKPVVVVVVGAAAAAIAAPVAIKAKKAAEEDPYAAYRQASL